MLDGLLGAELPLLPLLLWETPPGLELLMMQEGVPFQRVREPHRLAFRGGRFVLFDGRRYPARRLRHLLSPEHRAIDIESLRRTEPVDPFVAAVDVRGARSSWIVAGARLTETVARFDRAAIRRRILGRLSETIQRAGGLWAHLAAYPHPYRSAFNFRVDLDEPYPDDYARFAEARRPIAECTTHFLNTHAYGTCQRVLDDLRGLDTQSHAHFHFVYRSEASNRHNLVRADQLLREAGFGPVGYAAPEGRWNPGLGRVVEELGYGYASEFQLGFDDVPFFPWTGARFSPVLQVPVHPICEGLFLEAGIDDPAVIAGYLVQALRRKVEAGEPAFLYGHPERRLGRFPRVVTAIATEAAQMSLLWRVTLTGFADWWRWRASRRWSALGRSPGIVEIQFEEWDPAYRPALVVHRGGHAATFALDHSRVRLDLQQAAYVRRDVRIDLPGPIPAPRSWGLRRVLRAALDWETVTPLEELPVDTVPARLKKQLRRLRSPGDRR